MKKSGLGKLVAGAALLTLAATLAGSPVWATHSWNGYHWARKANPFTLVLGDNAGPAWDSYLRQASVDWSKATGFDTVVRAGTVGTGTRKCRPTSGTVQVCNDSYGRNGWLGVAQIWINGDHITQGTVKLNDSYFNLATYNKPEWRAFVVCQEVGHTFGLDHQDETQTNANLGTCMDYTSKPLGPPDNEHPNTHDYDELVITYQHLDSSTTIASSLVASAAPQDEWGRAIRHTREGKGRIFVKDLGPKRQVVTFVHWAPVEP